MDLSRFIGTRRGGKPKACFQRVFVIGSCCALIFDDEGNIDENCLFPGWSTSAAQPDDAAVIDKFIASQAEKTRGSEPDGIRKKQRNVP
jgi:hypothetical protein